jgi:hypothetical protein
MPNPNSPATIALFDAFYVPGHAVRHVVRLLVTCLNPLTSIFFTSRPCNPPMHLAYISGLRLRDVNGLAGHQAPTDNEEPNNWVELKRCTGQ